MSYTFSRRAFLKYSAATAVAVAGASLGFTGDHACIRLERRFLGFRYGVGFRFVDSFRLTVFLFLLFKDVG